MDDQAVADVVDARAIASPNAPVTEPDGRSAVSGSGIPDSIKSSPPTATQDAAMYIDRPNAGVDDNGAKSDSEAETIVLPGKDGHSPSKIRKSIKHEDKSEDEEMKDAPDIASVDGSAVGEREAPRLGRNGSELTATATSSLGKRKRPKNGHGNGNGSIKDDALPGNSSGLSSVPTSPVATTRSSLSKLAASDSELSKSPSPRSRSRSAVRDKAKSVDRVLARGKTYGSGDEDESESRRIGRQRSSGLDHKSSHASSRLDGDSNPRKRTRSVSPHSRGHRRSISTQLPSKSSRGLSHKKKRVPAPLQSTEYHSDESSASGNSHPRSSRVRNLAAPITGDSAMSPAKMAPHKKLVNSSGQTHLAVACSRGKLEVVKQRYEERPEDLNIPDNAFNTPLHIASLEGFIDIVQFLLDTGNCELDSQNIVKDTPLHDAIDNKNLEVVQLLLKAGANPSKPNQAGNEPLDLVNTHAQDPDNDDDIASIIEEMRKAIILAKERFASHRQRDSEGPQMHDNMSHAKGSPRQTPPMQGYDAQGGFAKVRTTARSMKTAEHGLYQSLDLNTLQVAARDGDIATASRIIEVKPNIDDPKTLYNAAKGGHDTVINLLFALGNFNPDPEAVDGAPADQPTPILAAIGKDHHLEVIKLFLANSDFNPTKRFKGEYYHEIARKRAGPKWQEEEELLKKAFEAYQKSHKTSPGKGRSPGLRRDVRDGERDVKKGVRRDDQPRPHKRTPSSPKLKESEPSKIQHRKSSSINQPRDGIKRGPGRPRKEESMALNAMSDRETSPLGPPKQKSQSRRSESEVAVTSETEPVKTRKRLISRKELNREETLEKQRRASIASNASGVSVKDKKERLHSESKFDKSDGKPNASVSRLPKNSSHSDIDSTSERQSEKDRARSIKREDSKDRLSAIRGESPIKRPRKSETPPRPGMQDVATAADRSGEAPQKRRKLAGPSVHKDTPSSSPEHRNSSIKSTLSKESSARQSSDAKLKPPRTQKHGDTLDVSKDPTSSDKSSPNRPPSSVALDSSSKKSKTFVERAPNGTNDKTLSTAKQDDEEALKQAQIRREKREAEAARQKEAEAARQKEAEAARQKEAEEEKQRIDQEKVEQAKQARLAREKAAQEEEEKKAREELERKERQRIEDAEAQQRAMEEQRARYLEQERLKREDQERRQALRLEQARIERIRIEKEKREERLSRLPLLLRWFDQASDPKTSDIARLFKKIVGYRYDTIKPEATGQTVGREQWMLNTDAAILLGEKDLQLSRYTAWERIPLSMPQKRGVWSTCNGLFLLLDGLPDLRKQFPQKGQSMDEIIEKNRSLFLELDLFFIKVTEFMFVVPNFPHLRGIEMEVIYKELQIPQTSIEVGKVFNEPKWKEDFPGQLWAPLPTYYINGNVTRRGEIKSTPLLKEPPPLDRFPRREGITRVYPGESDYEEICRKQNLHHLIPDYQASPVSATHPPPQRSESRNNSVHINGITPPRSDKSINGGSPSAVSDLPATEQLLNGTSGQEVDPLNNSG